MTGSLKICMIAVLGVAVTVIVKQWKSDFLPLIRMGLTVLFATVILGVATPLIQFVQELTNGNGMAEHAKLLFKALGIAVLTEVCANICRESGESGIAGGVELTGKVEILLLCLPLMSEVLSVAKSLMEMGG
ncbi:MAG: stage III sporulation AC/AD family protein [Clostridia bacterium]|nr:stage III sporulation AC/AD family protein [Clostridia bacterium]